MKILVINAGSSSLKYQLIDMTNEKVMAKGLVERIGIAGSNLVHKYGVDCGSKKKYEQAIESGMGPKRQKLAKRVLLKLFSKPITTVAGMTKLEPMSFQTASTIAKEMTKLGLFTEKTGFSRNRIFILREYLDLFSA